MGVDTTSLFPPDALRDKAHVGYVRSVSAEGVLSLRPTLVLAIDGAGPPDALDLIRRTGVAFASITDEPTPEGVTRKIDAIGAAVDKRKAAAALNRTVAAEFQALDSVRAKIARPLRVLSCCRFGTDGRSSAAARRRRTASSDSRAASMRPGRSTGTRR